MKVQILWGLLFVLLLVVFYWLVLKRALYRIFPETYGRFDQEKKPFVERFEGLRTILVARLHTFLGILAATVMGAKDFLDPILESSGYDWKDYVPADKAFWLIPLILIFSGLIFEWLRRTTTGSVSVT